MQDCVDEVGGYFHVRLAATRSSAGQVGGGRFSDIAPDYSRPRDWEGSLGKSSERRKKQLEFGQ